MKHRYSIYLFVFSCVLLFSCEKDIHLKVENQPAKLVVDASIEDGQFPIVVLSSSLNYFSSISPEELQNLFVHDATITINDGTQDGKFKEYSYKTDSGFTLYYYGIDLDFSSVKGQFNKTYQLNIKTKDGAEYTATTTIPALTKIIIAKEL